MGVTLYRKYRPKNFEEVYGQEHIKKSIINALNENKIAHAYLFNGPRGTGKTTVARIIARGVNCLTNGISANPCLECNNCVSITNGSNMDIIEIDAASNRGIDEIRILKENINYQPVNSRKKVYIIDEVHMLTNEAFNALLKTLEEPPEHAMFILATTEIHKLPDTIISRCICYNFGTLSNQEIKDMLLNSLNKENVVMDEESLELIFKKSGGSARDSLSLLEQVISSYYNEEIDYVKTARALGVIEKVYFENFNKLLKEKEKKEIIDFINDIYRNGIPIDVFLKDFCDYLRNNENDLEYTIRTITNIYNTVNNFKNEEDMRIVSYIIVYELLDKVSTVKISEVKETKKSNNIETKIDFEYADFLEYLLNNKQVFYNNVLLNFEFIKSEDYKIYLKQKNNRSEARAVIENEIS
ncbi:DNA polymerase III subunit gamma/tau [Oceanivirga salmonicida]|uniref:DNA polymerase III subunit gamma/tau n=1 Tax=Oceanivirga salmonicida TaxID=1769291 RepID=UPI0008355639|nr:DNA polymerase III subunit gamma/tau [Oceanivirga salmonicida]